MEIIMAVPKTKDLMRNPKFKIGDMYSSIRHHTIPQTHKFNCINYANHICRFENYDEEIMVIMEKLNIDKKIPHNNKSKNTHNYKDYCDVRTKNSIISYYEQDYTFLNYEL
jgi:hypothetical protein